MADSKTRTTAARLDRFKKPDGWAQMRVEEGFAVWATVSAENSVLNFRNQNFKMANKVEPVLPHRHDYEASRIYGREWPKPYNITPYYVAVVVLTALLILHGFLTHWGFVDYSPILK